MHYLCYSHVLNFHSLDLPLEASTDHPGSHKLRAPTQSSQVSLRYLLMHTIILALEFHQIPIFVHSYFSQRTIKMSDLVPAQCQSFETQLTLFLQPFILIKDPQIEFLAIFPIIMENFY